MTEPKDKLSGKQLAVVDDLVGGEMDETAVLEVHRVSQIDYRQWLEQTDFTALLQFQLDTTRRSAILLIAAYAPKAAERLLVLTRDKKPEVARRACLDSLSATIYLDAKKTKDRWLSVPDLFSCGYLYTSLRSPILSTQMRISLATT